MSLRDSWNRGRPRSLLPRQFTRQRRASNIRPVRYQWSHSAAPTCNLPAIVEAMMRPEMYPGPSALGRGASDTRLVRFHSGRLRLQDQEAGAVCFSRCPQPSPAGINCVSTRFGLTGGSRRTFTLGVVPNLETRQRRFRRGAEPNGAGESGTAVEWAVRMRRLGRPRCSIAWWRRAARALRKFVRSRLGSPPFIARRPPTRDGSMARRPRYGGWCGGNVGELALDCANAVTPGELDELERFAHRVIELRWSLLNRRALGGRVVRRSRRPALRACLARRRFESRSSIASNSARGCVTSTVASDIGFLAMDLDRLGARGLSDELVGTYRQASGDVDLPLLIPPYKVHRALVRAKVEGLTSRDDAIAPETRIAAAEAARRYVALALDFARESRPAMIVVCGLSGSGKSTVARRLADGSDSNCCAPTKSANAWPESRLPNASPIATRPAPTVASSTEKTTRRCSTRPAARLHDGAGVIVDATFAAPAYRAEALAIAERAHVPGLFVECVASHDEIVRRLTRSGTPRRRNLRCRRRDLSAPARRVRRAERDPAILPSRSRYGAGSRSSVGVNHRAAQEPGPRPWLTAQAPAAQHQLAKILTRANQSLYSSWRRTQN